MTATHRLSEACERKVRRKPRSRWFVARTRTQFDSMYIQTVRRYFRRSERARVERYRAWAVYEVI